jgi:hypothetical protein
MIRGLQGEEDSPVACNDWTGLQNRLKEGRMLAEVRDLFIGGDALLAPSMWHGRFSKMLYHTRTQTSCPTNWLLVSRYYSCQCSYLLTYVEGVEKLCEVESDLTGVDEPSIKEKNKGFWRRGKPCLELAYQAKAIVGPADLRFELCR